MHISQYRAAMDKVVDDPLALTAADYAALEEFGGAQDVQRARLAVAKRDRLPEAVGVQTKAAPARGARLDDVATLIGLSMKAAITPVSARIDAIEQRLAAADGIAPPAPAKPKVKLAGAWTRKLFEPGVGVTHDGKLFECLQVTFTEPSKDPTSWKQVA